MGKQNSYMHELYVCMCECVYATSKNHNNIMDGHIIILINTCIYLNNVT